MNTFFTSSSSHLLPPPLPSSLPLLHLSSHLLPPYTLIPGDLVFEGGLRVVLLDALDLLLVLLLIELCERLLRLGTI